MKNIQNLAMLTAVIAFASCQSNKRSTITETGNEVVKVRTPTDDTINKTKIPEAKDLSAEGIVTDINQGKDGYTAKIETADNRIYYVTVSHSNLNDPAQYRSVKIGDKLSVSGEYWKLEGNEQITVHEIK